MVRVSDILKKVFIEDNSSNNKKMDNKMYNIYLYANYFPDAESFRREKLFASKEGEVYTNERLKIGQREGEAVYKQIRIGSAKLSLGYDYIRSFSK